MDISVHPLTTDPTAAWEEISKTQHVVKVALEPPQSSVAGDQARVVCMSDTHSLTHSIKFDIPAGDIFIHAGDFTNCGQLRNYEEFNNWLGSLPHKHKIVIAGNHEVIFNPTFTDRNKTSGRFCTWTGPLTTKSVVIPDLSICSIVKLNTFLFGSFNVEPQWQRILTRISSRD